MEEQKNTNIVGVVLLMGATIMMIACAACMLSGCTYSITMVHTEGTASDVVDETATNTPSTSLSVPVSAAGL